MCAVPCSPLSAAARKGLKNSLKRLWKGAAGETGPVQVRRRLRYPATAVCGPRLFAHTGKEVVESVGYVQ